MCPIITTNPEPKQPKPNAEDLSYYKLMYKLIFKHECDTVFINQTQLDIALSQLLHDREITTRMGERRQLNTEADAEQQASEQQASMEDYFQDQLEADENAYIAWMNGYSYYTVATNQNL